VVLWENADKESTFLWEFIQRINKAYHINLKTYDELHQWSIQNVGEFWGKVWDFTGMQFDSPYEKVSGNFSLDAMISSVQL
jgi:acetoacetyl-CoA synthetase